MKRSSASLIMMAVQKSSRIGSVIAIDHMESRLCPAEKASATSLKSLCYSAFSTEAGSKSIAAATTLLSFMQRTKRSDNVQRVRALPSTR